MGQGVTCQLTEMDLMYELGHTDQEGEGVTRH